MFYAEYPNTVCALILNNKFAKYFFK